MKLSLLVSTLWLSLTTLIAVTQSIAPVDAHLISSQCGGINHSPDGTYLDRDWTIQLSSRGGEVYDYLGTNNRTKASISLAGATTIRTNNRRIYTWNNAGMKYRLTWNESDHDTIRLQVISPNGKVQLNRLLTYESGCGKMPL